jgi:hypothetical protein
MLRDFSTFDGGVWGTEAERQEFDDFRRYLREMVARTVRQRQEPVVEASDWELELATEILREDLIDEFFTLKALTDVPSACERWGRLRPVLIALKPSPKVSAYVRQATHCYLNGQYDAAAVMCRAVLEFALKDKLKAHLGSNAYDVGLKRHRGCWHDDGGPHGPASGGPGQTGEKSEEAR